LAETVWFTCRGYGLVIIDEMKRLPIIFALMAFGLGGGEASAATLKPLAAESAWNSEPIFATAPPGDPRLFVVERGTTQGGAAIRVLKDGILQPTPFLSIPNVNVSSERGLLSMAFAPDYETSGRFYVFWIANGPDALDPGGVVGDIRIVEFRRSQANPDVAQPASARLVLKQPHSAGNHNGGWMGFGPDGYLYFTIGDNAARNNGQSLLNLFGKVIRIDPSDPDGSGPLTATIPADNPFVSTPGARREIFTLGLRNPFRASFAPDGNLVVADVGESSWEEVNVGNLTGRNLGWPACEGPCGLPDTRFTDPFFSYSHANGCAIIGGYVVRDPDLTGLTGRYIYGDACRGGLRTLNLSVAGGGPADPGIGIGGGEGLRSFGEDSFGCVYVLTNRNAYRIAAGAEASADCPYPADTLINTVINTGPTGTITTNQATFTFAGSPTTDTARIQCRINSEPFTDCSSPKTFTGLPDGSHTVNFRAEDAAGNQDQTPATRTFTVDTTIYKARIGRVKVSGPAQASKARNTTYRILVSNSGNIDATGVKLQVKGMGVEAKRGVGKIAAGKSKSVKLELKFRKPGKVKLTFKVTSSNAGGKSARKTIRVRK